MCWIWCRPPTWYKYRKCLRATAKWDGKFLILVLQVDLGYFHSGKVKQNYCSFKMKAYWKLTPQLIPSETRFSKQIEPGCEEVSWCSQWVGTHPSGWAVVMTDPGTRSGWKDHFLVLSNSVICKWGLCHLGCGCLWSGCSWKDPSTDSPFSHPRVGWGDH